MRRVFLALLVLLLLPQLYCDDYSKKREEMVEKQIMFRGITDTKTLESMLTVPRHLFVPENLRDEAYSDCALPIGYGQTISQPYVVALMTSSLNLQGNEKALEIGTGSGYQAAVLAEIVDHIYTIEIVPELAQRAEATLQDLEYTNVTVKNADGYFGWEEYQPFDVIMITAAVDHIPPPLIQQLKDGGRLILPLGNPLYYQTLTLVEKRNGELYTKHVTDVTFVPMTGYAQEERIEEALEEPEKSTEPEEDKEQKGEEPEGFVYLSPFNLSLVGCAIVVILVITWIVHRKKDRP